MMRISVVITALNETLDLDATVVQVAASEPSPHEIIVVDDASTDPVALRCLDKYGARIIRHPHRQGVDPARRSGLEAATGDVVVFLDGHMRLQRNWLSYVKSAVSRSPNTLFCGCCVSADSAPDGSVWGGAEFCRVGHGGWIGLKWLKRRTDINIYTVPAVLGACYFIRTDVLRGIGGINPFLRGLGYSEQELSLRAWLCGLDIKCHRDLICGHVFSRKPCNTNPALADGHSRANVLVTAATIWGDSAAEALMPHVQRVFGSDALIHFDNIRNKIASWRSSLRWGHTPSDVPQLCGYKFPEDSELVDVTNNVIQDRHARANRKKPILTNDDALRWKGHVRSGTGSFGKMVFPELSVGLRRLRPGSLNVIVSAWPRDYIRATPNGAHKPTMDNLPDTYSPDLVIKARNIKNNVIRPTEDRPDRGDMLLWRARLWKKGQQPESAVRCYLARSKHVSYGSLMELVSDRHLRSELSLRDGDSVRVELVRGLSLV